ANEDFDLVGRRNIMKGDLKRDFHFGFLSGGNWRRLAPVRASVLVAGYARRRLCAATSRLPYREFRARPAVRIPRTEAAYRRARCERLPRFRVPPWRCACRHA